MAGSFLSRADVAGLPPAVADLVWFACSNMNRSYKPVLLRILLTRAEQSLDLPFEGIRDEFALFYSRRLASGLAAERVPCPFVVGDAIDRSRAAERLRRAPLERFRIAGYVTFARGRVKLVDRNRWRPANPEVLSRADQVLERAVAAYYAHWLRHGKMVAKSTSGEAGDYGRFLVLPVPHADSGDEVPTLWASKPLAE